jgi:hypothetical protein
MRISASHEAKRWARNEFGHADLGDTRRRSRLVAMGACACARPNGKVSEVFTTEREREGAYDFLESDQVAPEAVMASVAEATGARCRGLEFVYVPTDGSSLTLPDHDATKDFGKIGNHRHRARGLKVIDALAVDPSGVTIGWLALTFWTRRSAIKRPRSNANRARRVETKETFQWLTTIKTAGNVLERHGVRAWFQVDREGDGRDVLLTLHEGRHWWTVRSNADRSIEIEDGDVGSLRAHLGEQAPEGSYTLDVPGRANRSARTANMMVRFARVRLRLRNRRTKTRRPLEVTAVWAREEATTPDGEKPLDWLLFTNWPVQSFDDGLMVVRGYAQRWRVEEAHRAWKSGVCDVEQMQLRSSSAAQKWAIILAAVAARVERLKRLARTMPDVTAAVELTPVEIRALVLLKRKYKKRKERIAKDMVPTIAQAVLWIAEFGGYTGKQSGGPPGATTIRRGLDYLRPAADMLALLGEQQK